MRYPSPGASPWSTIVGSTCGAADMDRHPNVTTEAVCGQKVALRVGHSTTRKAPRENPPVNSLLLLVQTTCSSQVLIRPADLKSPRIPRSGQEHCTPAAK